MANSTDKAMDLLFIELMEKAELQGFLLTDDIAEAIPDGSELSDRLEEIVQQLQEAGIDVYDAKAAHDDPVIFEEVEVELEADEEELEDLLSDEDLDMAAVVSDDTVGLYLKEMTRVPLLSSEEEVRIAKQIEKGRAASKQLSQNIRNRRRAERLQTQVNQGLLAREHLIKANTRLVVSIAKRYMGQGVPFLDLIQ